MKEKKGPPRGCMKKYPKGTATLPGTTRDAASRDALLQHKKFEKADGRNDRRRATGLLWANLLSDGFAYCSRSELAIARRSRCAATWELGVRGRRLLYVHVSVD